MRNQFEIETLRHADPAEKKRLFCLIGEYFADPDLRRAFGRPMTSTPEYTWVIAIGDDGEIAGFAGLRVQRNRKAELCHSYTTPAYRGKGFNTWSIQERLRLAVAQGATEIITTIKPARARKYIDVGFVEHGRRGQYAVYTRSLP